MKIAENQISGTYHWANAMSIAGFIIAIASPIFGAIADYAGYHRTWLSSLTLISIISTALLWFAYPQPNMAFYTLVCVVMGTVGLETAMVFYNALLTRLTSNDNVGRISGWGWGAGYFGGILSLTFVLLVFIKGNYLSLDKSTAEQIRICGPFVAVWYAIFSLPLFFFMPKMRDNSTPTQSQAIKQGLRKLINTFRQLPSQKSVCYFLFANMLYKDGLTTLFAFGGIYAAGTFGFSVEEVLLLGICLNVSAGIGAIFLGWMDDVYGSRKTIGLSLMFVSVMGAPLTLIPFKSIFWVMATFVGIFVGPIQSASRSLMIRLIEDKESATEMFGLFSLSGKLTSFAGPGLLGLVVALTHSQRAGMATIIIFFVIGALFLVQVEEPPR